MSQRVPRHPLGKERAKVAKCLRIYGVLAKRRKSSASKKLLPNGYNLRVKIAGKLVAIFYLELMKFAGHRRR